MKRLTIALLVLGFGALCGVAVNDAMAHEADPPAADMVDAAVTPSPTNSSLATVMANPTAGITGGTDLVITALDQISGDVGAVGHPTYSITGDLTTGIWQSAASNIDFAIAGSNVLNLSATGITIPEGMTIAGVVTGSAAPAESIFDFQGTNSGTGTHPANIVNVEWAGVGGSGAQRGVRVNAPTGWTGDGLWFGVNGAEMFAVDETGSAIVAASFIAPTLNVDDYQKGISYVANSGVHIFSRGSAGPNNSVCLVDYASRGKSYDHANQATPTFWFQSDENPDVSNQEWGSITHDGTDFVLGTGGPAAGTGSAPTTIRNSIRMDQNLVTTLQSGGDNQAATLGVGATTVAITTDFLTLTGDGGGNTIGTITGGITGQTLRVLCVDADVAITDTDAHTADTVDLSAAFTCADDTVLTLLYDGTSWYETSRSVN